MMLLPWAGLLSLAIPSLIWLAGLIYVARQLQEINFRDAFLFLPNTYLKKKRLDILMAIVPLIKFLGAV